MRYRRTRRDANHNAIVTALEQIGCSVIDLAACGGGVPDLLVGRIAAGGRRNFLLEIKNPAHHRKSGSTDARVAEKQAKFRAMWNGHQAVVETVDQAIAAVTA